MRRTLLSDLPRSSDAPPSEPAPASGVEAAGSKDFGRWLIRDLRAKGSQVSPAGRASQPPTVLIPVPEQAELANWLLLDLKPRDAQARARQVHEEQAHEEQAHEEQAHDLQAGSSAPAEEREAPESVLPLSSPGALASGTLGDALAPDSLVPHAVSEAPLALGSALEPALEEDDLAVLPSRRGKSGQRSRRRALVLLAALLGVAGLALWLRSGEHAELAHDSAPAASASLAAVPLPPPPPDVVETSDRELEVPAVVAAARRSAAPAAAAASAEEEDLEPALRGRRAGDAVARFADLPLSTQSKLAREERQKTRARDASARARKAAGSARP